ELPPGKKGEVMHMSLPDKKGPAAQAGTYMKPSKKVEKTPALKLEAPAENPKENETSPASGKPAESSQP
ncbi:MAG TPA: hypothetical protein VMB78_02380, partial [Dissulfurispiraceae bacterium]|nr:hypothetical protein [Dissulfurispiraceae bacterium]